MLSDENEIWKIVKEVSSPNGEKKWTLEENGELIEEESKISKLFNNFFITKIQDIKANIDQTKVENPYTKLEEKMKQKKLKFSLSQVSAKTVEKAIKSLKMKRSAGADNLTQEQLKLGADELVIPLTEIINKSIAEILCISFYCFLIDKSASLREIYNLLTYLLTFIITCFFCLLLIMDTLCVW